MAITIKGIQVDGVHLEHTKDGYGVKQAEYSLISSAGKVLAKQVIGGYQGMVMEPSDATKAALDAFTKSYINDVQTLLGLSE